MDRRLPRRDALQDTAALRASYERSLDVNQRLTRAVAALQQLYGAQLRAAHATYAQQRALDALDVAAAEAAALLAEAGR